MRRRRVPVRRFISITLFVRNVRVQSRLLGLRLQNVSKAPRVLIRRPLVSMIVLIVLIFPVVDR